MEAFNQTPDQAVAAYGSDKTNGLTPEQVKENGEKFGRNEFTKSKRKSLLRRIWEAATEPMLILLFFAWVITIAVNAVSAVQGGHFDVYECIGIFVAIIISVVLTVVMEGRSAKAFDELNKIKEGVEIKVVRGGVVQYVPQQELVVGDIVFLETGNKVAADGRLLESVSLTSDESSLTGESVPVEKNAEAVFDKADVPVAERVNMVYSGCFITGGTGKMVVTDVGDNTQFGLIAREIQVEGTGQTPLQEKMGRLGKAITLIGGVFSGLIFLIQLIHILVSGNITFESISSVFITSIVLMVAAVPEGLPTIVAISLSINIARMAKQNALVKKMVACETIGCINVICSDKTGTLTENRMTVTDVWAHGKFTDAENFRDEQMLENFCLNSTADLFKDESGIRFVGNPTEGALLVFAQKVGTSYQNLRESAEISDLYPFSSDTKNMTCCVRKEKGYIVYTKGSPEKILALCNVDPDTRRRAEEEIVGLQKRARRVLGFAHKEVSSRPASRADAERGMVFDGFVGIADPLRTEVKDAVNSCKTAGIEVKMLTGDNIVTASAIAEELGLLEEGHIAVEASYLEKLSDEEFSKVLPTVRVIARSTPLLKMRVVKELKSKGNVVAVTGDGINDAPALKNADVGIAMGISGTEVSKEAADIVLLNDSFSTIVTTVKWGRGIYENFKRFIQFQLTVNVASVLLVFLCTVLGLFWEGFESPFSALDLLWINIIMDGPPALT
ncbi:MAG TPA: calcium-translocating P-type ATPase, PMCA-type, partial [Candidatus Borkfalkia faecipullorum]|nr:calcium-translocating P-type ATPase, PMCA-type [Candidatus Borkfalkia faecipullorum]